MNRLAPWIRDYGMLGILLVLSLFFTLATLDDQNPLGADAAQQLLSKLDLSKKPTVVIITDQSPDVPEFLRTLNGILPEESIASMASGLPSDARAALQAAEESSKTIDAILCSSTAGEWDLLQNVTERFPRIGKAPILKPKSYRWSNFLKRSNLINIADQIVVIAVIAIGMTMVIIAGGIDLSVGSLIALSAVVATRLIRDSFGGVEANSISLVLCGLTAIAVCGCMGWITGMFIHKFDVPPFIVTLAMMLVAKGTANMLSGGESIADLPDQFVWLGRGVNLGLPNAVWLMLILYALAHWVMSSMIFGRYIYAVGGNVQAARLSGIPVGRTTVAVYVISGLLAGLGGVIMASRLKSGAGTYGITYELSVIASVVIGGTSLSGGEGKILGTLIGSLIIAVILNGMNLTGVGAHPQDIVLGLVILFAVLLDRLRKKHF